MSSSVRLPVSNNINNTEEDSFDILVGGGRDSRRSSLDAGDDDEGNDDEVKRGLKENPVVDSGGSRSFGCRERGLGCAGQINE